MTGLSKIPLFINRHKTTPGPEQTPHSKPTLVWTYISTHVWLILRVRLHWRQNRHNTAN